MGQEVVEGRLAENILYFARLLRSAGLPVGPGRMLDAVTAVRLIGFGRQEDFYACLFSLFVTRSEQRELFDQAFHIFWRNPHILERMMSAMLPTVKVERPDDMEELSRRLADALQLNRDNAHRQQTERQVEFDASLSFSPREVLQHKDFEAMSAEEFAAARNLVSKLRLSPREYPTRRQVVVNKGQRIDLRGTLRSSLRSPQSITLRFRKPRRRRPPLVILCDISGSMSRYSRIFLHFLHSVTNDRDRIHAFVFATRLTNVTRSLRHRDVDVALERVAGLVRDWDGGTRIGACLGEFNKFWSRRVLGQGAITLIVSDGLDREGAEGLAEQMERLAKSSRRLIWLNPLLRYEDFEPKARGVQAMLPWVDEFRSVHNLQSLGQLSALLAGI